MQLRILARASWRRLRELHEAGSLTGEIWRELETQHNAERTRLDQEMHALYLDYGELERAARVALSEAMRRGLITDDAFRKLAAEVDQRLEALDLLADLPEDSKTAQ
jgi:hypothetical protein